MIRASFSMLNIGGNIYDIYVFCTLVTDTDRHMHHSRVLVNLNLNLNHTLPSLIKKKVIKTNNFTNQNIFLRNHVCLPMSEALLKVVC